MYHTTLRKRIREKGLLHSAMLELTYRCNLDCFFCYNDKDAPGEPLAFEDYVKLFADLARLQVLFLTFTGGEPMTHPRFLDLGEGSSRTRLCRAVAHQWSCLAPCGSSARPSGNRPGAD